MKINAYKIRLAQRFLNELKKELKKIKTKETLTLEMYSNGREQGYHLSLLVYGEKGGADQWGCSFSENRNSDELVIYVGEGLTEFQMGGNIPNERVYASKKFFYPEGGELLAAVYFITDSLKAFLPKEKEALHA